MNRSTANKPVDNMANVLLTVDEACERLRISRWTLYRLIHTNQLLTIKLGTRRLVPTKSILNLVDDRLSGDHR